MQILNTILLILRFWEIGSPSRVLLPCTCLLFAILHGFLRWGKNGHGRWLPVLLTATILACEVTILLLHSYLAMLVVIGMCYAEAALLGTGLGELFYRFFDKKVF